MIKVPLTHQYAALPFRRRVDGVIEVLLITSRETRRWVVPKGWPVPGLAPHDSAACEAREEAGVVGRVGERSIGVYRYEKRLPDGSAMPCSVEVFALEIEQQLDSWEEQDERRIEWFEAPAAANAVDEPQLSAIIRTFAARIG